MSGVFTITGVTPSDKYNIPSAGVGNTVTVTLTTFPSTSVPIKLTGTFIFSTLSVLPETAMGGSFTSIMVGIVTFEGVEVSPPLSVTVNTTGSTGPK